MEITAEMIEKRRKENISNSQKKWREKNRDKVNAYAREWRARYKAKHGVSYNIANGRKLAEAQLREEMENK